MSADQCPVLEDGEHWFKPTHTPGVGAREETWMCLGCMLKWEDWKKEKAAE